MLSRESTRCINYASVWSYAVTKIELFLSHLLSDRTLQRR